LIQGFATPKGTELYAQKHSSLRYVESDRTGLLVSQAGFGCYRVNAGVATHVQALKKALLAGVNLIDTSSNYGDGGAETFVGDVFEDLISSGDLSREAAVVVSKVGYLQGHNYQLSQERKRKGDPFKELVLYGEGLEHCIHPEFLEDQLSRSLERLKLNTLDFYLLHNPEYYLSWANKSGIPLDEAREEYYDRIGRAFSHLETEVDRGRIRFYGISSNTLPSPAVDPSFTSLERVWTIAESLSEQHRFRIIQLPMNLLETGGITENNQANDECIIEFARDKNLGVLINRPLNAIVGNRLVRLASVQSRKAASEDEISARIGDLVRSEDSLKQRILPGLDLTSSLQAQVIEQISIGETLMQHWRDLETYERWQELQSSYFLPRILGVIQFLSQRSDATVELCTWIESHQEKLENVFLTVASVYQEAAAEKSAQLRAVVSSVDKDWAEAATLSQMAVRALRSTAGITTVLVGMRQEAYVQDVLEELGRPVNSKDRTESWIELHEALIQLSPS
jgi:aryl-alcohol dehydrogenase-like predicted oxidoreductase